MPPKITLLATGGTIASLQTPSGLAPAMRAEDLLTFARLYFASADGVLDDARPLGALRTKALARIPGYPCLHDHPH